MRLFYRDELGLSDRWKITGLSLHGRVFAVKVLQLNRPATLR